MSQEGSALDASTSQASFQSFCHLFVGNHSWVLSKCGALFAPLPHPPTTTTATLTVKYGHGYRNTATQARIEFHGPSCPALHCAYRDLQAKPTSLLKLKPCPHHFSTNHPGSISEGYSLGTVWTAEEWGSYRKAANRSAVWAQSGRQQFLRC